MQQPEFDAGEKNRRRARPSVRLTTTLMLSTAGCDIETFSTRPGKHVIYHWEPDERMLCGGTVAYADRLAETMANHYGMSLDDDAGPTVEYFWSVADVGSLACFGGFACTRGTPTTRNRWLSSIYSELPIHGHELAHAFVGAQNGGIPGFMDEGLAIRWQSSVLGDSYIAATPLELNEAQLRAQIDQLAVLSDHSDDEAAFVWLAVLEVTFGPEKMGEFLRSLNALSSSDEVDKALRRTMGISLAVSVELAAGSLPFILDDPVCEMEGVPTFRWEGRPIVIDRRDARCEDEDIVNRDARAKSIVILEFPDDLHAVNVTVSGASDLLYFSLQHCYENVNWSSPLPWNDGALSDGLTREMDLRGRWVGSLIGDIDDDGNVLLPRVEIAPVSMTNRTSKIWGLTCALILCAPQLAVAAEPPPPSATVPRSPQPTKAKRQLVAGSVLVGLGFAAELSGSIIATSCIPNHWCSWGLALTLGEPTGPSRYAFVSAGPSSAYIGGRIAAAPFLASGFTLMMVGLASRHADGVQPNRRVAWGLFGAGIGVLAASRVLRAVFLASGTCQAALCTHGFDQSSLWVGRSLTFVGTGLLVQGRGRLANVMLGSGPPNSYGLSVAGRF